MVMEREVMQISSYKNIEFVSIPTTKFVRKLTLKNLAIPFKLIKGIVQTKKILKQIKPDQDVILISDNGTIIRLVADQISKIGRNTQGVKIMRLKDKNYKVVCASVTEHEEYDEEDDPQE